MPESVKLEDGELVWAKVGKPHKDARQSFYSDGYNQACDDWNAWLESRKVSVAGSDELTEAFNKLIGGE
jgi:hypothetical protein